MIEQAGRIVALQGDYAMVETARETACGSCAAHAGCGTSALARLFAGRTVQLKVINSIAAQVGDRVVVGVPAAGLTRGSLAVYLVPLAGLFAGALAGNLVGTALLASGTELFAVAGAGCGLLVALAWLRGFSRSIENHRDYQPVILRQVLSSGGNSIEISQHNGARSC